MSNNSRLHNLLTLNIETRGKIVSLTNSKGEGTTNYAYLFANKLGSISKGSESISFEYDGTLLTKSTQTGVLYIHLNKRYKQCLHHTSNRWNTNPKQNI